NRMLQPREVNPNLMRSSGLEFNIKQRERLVTVPDFEQRQCPPAPGDNCHARSIPRIASNRLLNGAALLFHHTVDQGNVTLENLTRAKLIAETLMRGFSLRRDQQSGRIFVE